MYKKRSGTSAIHGQLYETKLLSLVLLRAQNDDAIEEFYLASNMDGIGAFDDICFKARIKGSSRPLVAFIQAKHIQNTKFTAFDDKNMLLKYFESYVKLKQKFDPKSQDKILNEQFDEIDCFFIIYTTQKSKTEDYELDHHFANNLNSLIATGKLGCHLFYTENDVQFLSKIIIKQEIINLVKHLSKYLNTESYLSMMNDEYILRYHVMLAKKVLTVSEIKPEGYRVCKFLSSFICTTDEFLSCFREKLSLQLLRNQKLEDKETHNLLKCFFSKPSKTTLSNVIEKVITYKNEKFEFIIDNMPETFKEELYQINLPQSVVNQAVELAAHKILITTEIKVPSAFGNLDLLIRGNQDKIERRLNYLASSIVQLIEKSKPNNVVTIDESIGDGLLKHNGGLGSAIGNILSYEDNTMLIRFTENPASLKYYAKCLFEKLQNKITNFHEIRFNVNVNMFPKPSFNSVDQSLARSFLNSLVIYSEQANENYVEILISKEIEDYQSSNSIFFRIKSDAIFLKYHDKIQKWWMLPKEASYLTKECNIYKHAVRDILKNPLISIAHIIYMNKMKGMVNSDLFNQNTIQLLKSQGMSSNKIIIVTDRIIMTVVKITQCLKNQEYVILDLNYIFGMLSNEFNLFNLELKKANKNDTVIIVYENVQRFSDFYKKIKAFTQAIDSHKIIIITEDVSVKTIKQHFLRIDSVIYDQKHSMIDLSQDTQKNVLESASVIFQGQEMSLNILVDELSVLFIQGAVLNDILVRKPIVIGESLNDNQYNTIKDLHVDRRVNFGGKSADKKVNLLRSFYDINDDVVLVTAKPGMGKSTLLTQLSLKTKQLDSKVWIVRVNLLDHAGEFSKWKQHKKQMNPLKALEFMCHIVIGNKCKDINKLRICLGITEGVVNLIDLKGADDLVSFELKMFLHFYNRRNTIFLFDGFDEICPHYQHEVISLLNSIRNSPRLHKMWLTSRSYNEIKSILEENFGRSYDIEPFDHMEQDMYLEKFWQTNLILHELNAKQIENLQHFKDFISKIYKDFLEEKQVRMVQSFNQAIIRVYSHFEDYLKNNLKMNLVNRYKTRNFSGVTAMIDLLLLAIQQRESFLLKQEFAGNPLHLYLIADHLINKIKDDNTATNGWDIDLSSHSIYEGFLETKLKKIRFQDKNKMDLDKPDILMTYEKERAEFFAKHKMLAAYAILYTNSCHLFTKMELRQIKAVIKAIKKGEEKTGVICSIVNNIPQFIHFTFAEYFAVEYVTDLLKKVKNIKRQQELWSLLIDVMYVQTNQFDVSILLQKLKTDADLAIIVGKIETLNKEQGL